MIRLEYLNVLICIENALIYIEKCNICVVLTSDQWKYIYLKVIKTEIERFITDKATVILSDKENSFKA